VLYVSIEVGLEVNTEKTKCGPNIWEQL